MDILDNQPQNPVPSLRQRIKAASRGTHDKLDSDPISLELMSGQAKMTSYQEFLCRTYGFLQPIEELLFAENATKLAVPFWAPTERRTPNLIEDLKNCGITDEQIRSLPKLSDLPDISTRGHLMGAAYVIEGSAIGGLVLAKPVRKSLDLAPEQMSFFVSDEPRNIVRKFEQFADALDGFAFCECDESDAMDAALQTFEIIDRWFQTWKKPAFLAS